MAGELTSYRRTVRLGPKDLESALPVRMALDEKVMRLLASAAASHSEFEVERLPDEGMQVKMRVFGKGLDVLITTRCGQDTVYRDGRSDSFVSYSVSSRALMDSLGRAESASKELTFALRGIFALVLAAAFSLFLGLVGGGAVHLSVTGLIIMGGIGAVIGERAGSAVGAKMEALAWRRAEKRGTLPALEALWVKLREGVDGILDDYTRSSTSSQEPLNANLPVSS